MFPSFLSFPLISPQDVVATYTKARGKHGAKETSEEQYGRALARRFKSVVGEPAWAALDREEEDSDEEFLRSTQVPSSPH